MTLRGTIFPLPGV